MLRHSADALNGFGMPAGTLSWFLLNGLSIPRMSWPMILQSVGGGWPTTDEQLEQILTSLRRYGHISEHTHHGPVTMQEGYNRPAHTGNYYHEQESYSNDDAIAYFGHESALTPHGETYPRARHGLTSTASKTHSSPTEASVRNIPIAIGMMQAGLSALIAGSTWRKQLRRTRTQRTRTTVKA